MRIKLILISSLLASCSGMTTPSWLHTTEVRQGNSISAEMREKIKEGMSAEQVRAVLGTPLINDPFHANRWDYVYRLQQAGKVVEQQRLTLHFENDRLVRIEDSEKSAVK
jgi:outer membrane protein assembly factor BamE